MPASLAELNPLTTDQLYRRLLASDCDDKLIKVLLTRRLVMGDLPTAVKQDVTTIHPRLVDSDLEPRDGDTDLTKLVKEAWIAGYRCQDLDNPTNGVKYMARQVLLNWHDESHKQTRDFWAMWKNHYTDWKIASRSVG